MGPICGDFGCSDHDDIYGDKMTFVNASFPLDLSPYPLDLSLLRLDLSPIASQVFEIKYEFSPELIELIEQEGASRFFVNIWSDLGRKRSGNSFSPACFLSAVHSPNDRIAL